MTSINLIFRSSSRTGCNEGSLFFRLIHERKSRTVTIPGCRLCSEEWDKSKQTIIYPVNDPVRFAFLKEVEQKLRQESEQLNIHLAALQKQGYYTVDEVVRLYRLRKDDGKLLGFTDILVSDLESNGQYRTARAYHTVVRGLVGFNKNVDIPLTQINSHLIKGFEAYLKQAGKLPNTISYYMRNLRAIHNKALLSGQLMNNKHENPFDGVYTGVTKTMKRALTLDEMKSLCQLDFDSLLAKENLSVRKYFDLTNLYTALQYFKFCFYARGMCFVDLAYLRKDCIRGGVLRYVRKKTGQQIEVKVTKEMQDIIDAFASLTEYSSYLFPVIRENDSRSARLQYETALRTQNARLKRLVRLAGIGKQISTHWARHSWATICKQRNVPLGVISECLGHTSEKTTLIYLGTFDNSVLDAANEAVASAVLQSEGRVRTSVF